MCVIVCYVDSGSKKPRLDQIPASNLDADDPIDDDVSTECNHMDHRIFFLKSSVIY